MKTFKEHIIKTGEGYKLVSKKTGKNLGTATSKAGILKRERQVEYFKHMHEDAPAVAVGDGSRVAGLGVGTKGEPGVNKKKSLTPFLSFIRRKAPV